MAAACTRWLETPRDAAEKKAPGPKTLEQVDSLEKLLSEALEALRARRAELQKVRRSRQRKASYRLAFTR